MIVLFTDTDTDFTPEECKQYNMKLMSMPYSIGEEIFFPWVSFDNYDYKTFYNMLRNGIIPKTAALSVGEYINYFEPIFKEGNDIFYIHFSSALSGSFGAMQQAYEELKETYPDRKLYTLDTKMITIGSHVIVEQVAKKFMTGAPIDEVIAYGNDLVKHYAMYFFTEDLKFFAYSGRISNFAASMGRILGFRPLIYLNEEGKMIQFDKVRGTKSAVKYLVDKMVEIGDDVVNHPILIGHSDAGETVNVLANAIKEKFGENIDLQIYVVNPTIGSHCGPQGVGVAFHSKGK